MTQVFLYQNPNEGNICIGVPAEETLKSLTIEQIALKDTPPGVDFYIVNVSELPPLTLFFDAWVFSTPPNILIDLNKSKGLYKQKADNQSSILSQPLVQEYMRLAAIDADTTAIQRELKAINAAAEETAYLYATSVTELTACWPLILGPNPFLPPVIV